MILIKYTKSFKTLFFTIITINSANIAFALGGITTFMVLKNFLINKVYLYSRSTKNKSFSSFFGKLAVINNIIWDNLAAVCQKKVVYK